VHGKKFPDEIEIVFSFLTLNLTTLYLYLTSSGVVTQSCKSGRAGLFGSGRFRA